MRVKGGGGLVTKSCPTLATPWTVAHQASLSTGFPRQEYWSGLSFPPPGDLSNPAIEPMSPSLADRFLTAEPPGKPLNERGPYLDWRQEPQAFSPFLLNMETLTQSQRMGNSND